MLVRTTLGILALLGLLASTPLITAGSYAAAATLGGTTLRQARSHGERIDLAPPLKRLWRKELHAELKAMPKNERRRWLRSQWVAMSDRQKQAKTTELEGKWKALPANVQQAILKKTAEHREVRRGRRQQGRGSATQSGHDNTQG